MGREPAEILSKERFYSCEITEFMSNYGENAEPKEWICPTNRVVPPLPGGRILDELDRTRQSHRRESSEFGTLRREKSGNVEAAGVGANRGEG